MKSVQEAPLARYVREYSALPGAAAGPPRRVHPAPQRYHALLQRPPQQRGRAVSYYTAALEEVPACRLLCYLYENSIGPEQLRDVLSDFCGRTL